ncbi:bifunctional 4-hydroxy-2-oxoglutarate aldolase/2-dehydro-3-deoxy-phosphogluconate aldolase [Allopontixanthobacter sediminis]|uniref:2-dehydro-3-deoxy-phosphogluconate aldolase n=1 Tax=Allopontixanthobacter sediminis TaxID=1689985 RepID=A0A845B4F6_9SPHN|nr:bifunctional 4-hydroxy-2-oxoglutarate aldolase/2-dehydro-3-deoxy-phosphogluconate aldolase [Allopontixanthobacter sediminis]MXP45056.1 bifunctional 4-hydroxy-2-oxoglutarate aldolase/2-dehydro-3-deoxy-phosphogluconate aldolase [Allopontixanthobacter sediminis]
MKPIESILRSAPVIPVIVIDDLAHAVPLAQALVAGGLNVLEVTLRTPQALDAIRAMKQVEGAIVGAGTVTNPSELDAALEAGSEFIVSPGLTTRLANAAIEHDVPFLPGIANAGDIMMGLDLGLTHFKFFPAMAAGGLPALKALAAPFGQCLFCPTGGISLANAPQWLAFEPVLCVGGSWVAPQGNPDVPKVEAVARQAAAMGSAGAGLAGT